ncbi:MAG: hypothetical protein U0670_07325 [Anaerolineae bacterium]
MSVQSGLPKPIIYLWSSIPDGTNPHRVTHNDVTAIFPVVALAIRLYILRLSLRPGLISELAGVDEQGNIYYWDYPLSQNTPLLTIFDPTGQFIEQIPTQTLVSIGAGNYLYQSVTGEIVFLNNDLPSGLASIDLAGFVPTPTPTSTPLRQQR